MSSSPCRSLSLAQETPHGQGQTKTGRTATLFCPPSAPTQLGLTVTQEPHPGLGLPSASGRPAGAAWLLGWDCSLMGQRRGRKGPEWNLDGPDCGFTASSCPAGLGGPCWVLSSPVSSPPLPHSQLSHPSFRRPRRGAVVWWSCGESLRADRAEEGQTHSPPWVPESCCPCTSLPQPSVILSPGQPMTDDRSVCPALWPQVVLGSMAPPACPAWRALLGDLCRLCSPEGAAGHQMGPPSPGAGVGQEGTSTPTPPCSHVGET